MAVSLKLPLVLVDDADLVRVSAENPGNRFEREEDGTLTVSPTFTNGGARSGEAFFQVRTYANVAGGRAFDANTGFAIGPLRAIKSPDAAWVSRVRIESLTETELAGFWPLSPDVAIEAASASDDFGDTIAKIELYSKHGTAYAVAIDPRIRRVVEVGEAPAGLSLDFDAIIDA